MVFISKALDAKIFLILKNTYSNYLDKIRINTLEAIQNYFFHGITKNILLFIK